MQYCISSATNHLPIPTITSTCPQPEYTVILQLIQSAGFLQPHSVDLQDFEVVPNINQSRSYIQRMKWNYLYN